MAQRFAPAMTCAVCARKPSKLLERLKNAEDAQLTSVESVPSNGATAGAAPDTNAHASVDPAPKAGMAAFPAGNQK